MISSSGRASSYLLAAYRCQQRKSGVRPLFLLTLPHGLLTCPALPSKPSTHSPHLFASTQQGSRFSPGQSTAHAIFSKASSGTGACVETGRNSWTSPNNLAQPASRIMRFEGGGRIKTRCNFTTDSLVSVPVGEAQHPNSTFTTTTLKHGGPTAIEKDTGTTQ